MGGPYHGKMPETSTQRALQLIHVERLRQLEVERFNDVHDDRYTHGELAMAAASYAVWHTDATWRNTWWPWAQKWWKPTTPERNLVKAGALIIAELERLERAELDKSTPQTIR